MKKAQGLSLNTIIIAAIVLIVLIVLWAIFTGRMGTFTKGLKDEETKAKEVAGEFEEEAVGLGKCDPATDKSTCTNGKLKGCSISDEWVITDCANGCNSAGDGCA